MDPTTLLHCAHCGKPIPSSGRFCMGCGFPTPGGLAGETVAASASTLVDDSEAAPIEAERQARLQQLLAEATLGEFEILGELGRGGMATVYLAYDLSLDRKVAIKVIAPTLLTAPGAPERFKREARTAAGLSHPHIIPIHAVRETPTLLYLVMKFVEGRALDDILRAQRRLPIRMVLAILSEVGHALAYAHRRHIVHRDIKPANIMLDGDGWAVVTDFGIAKVLESSALTASGTVVGTPYYMSPEQCAGKPVAGPSDQYSLGIVAYEMLTGHPPFAGATIMEIMKGHFFEAPAPLAEARHDCPRALASVVTRMLAKSPEERWPTLDEAVAAMEASPLAADDPVRSEMIALARSNELVARLSRLSVPVSPIPAGLNRPRPGPSAERRTPGSEPLAGQSTTAERSGGWLKAVGITLGVVTLAGGGVLGGLYYRNVIEPRNPPAAESLPPPVTNPAAATAPSAADSTASAPADRAAAESLKARPNLPAAAGPQAPSPEAERALAGRRAEDGATYARRLAAHLDEVWVGTRPQALDVPADDQASFEITVSRTGDMADFIPPAGAADALSKAASSCLRNAVPFEPLPLSQAGAPLQLRVTFTKTGVSVTPK